MAREKPDYRGNLELINSMFPGKAALTYAEISRMFGYHKVTAQRKWASYYNKGRFQLFGTYRTTEGNYRMSIRDVIRKDFTFQPRVAPGITRYVTIS